MTSKPRLDPTGPPVHSARVRGFGTIGTATRLTAETSMGSSWRLLSLKDLASVCSFSDKLRALSSVLGFVTLGKYFKRVKFQISDALQR